MSKVVVTKEKLVAIGDALREKTETTEAYSLDEMPEVIQGIETGGGGADFTISDASCLFRDNARIEQSDNIMKLLDKELTGIASMFYNCNNITDIDLSHYDTSKVTLMSYVFFGCTRLENLDISSFNTSNVTDMNSMFAGCQSLGNLDLSNFDTAKNKSFLQFFSNCRQMTSINMSNFDTSACTNFNNMFAGCDNLEEIIGFSATNKAGLSIGWMYGNSAGYKKKLNRLTFRTDLPAGKYSIRSAINIKHCSFDREGMVEMFNSLPDITNAGVSANYKKITITGNPCLTDGTLTDEDRAIATGKGWTLVE